MMRVLSLRSRTRFSLALWCIEIVKIVNQRGMAFYSDVAQVMGYAHLQTVRCGIF